MGDVPWFINLYGSWRREAEYTDTEIFQKYKILTGGRPYYVDQSSDRKETRGWGPNFIIIYLEHTTNGNKKGWYICKARDTMKIVPIYRHYVTGARKDLEHVPEEIMKSLPEDIPLPIAQFIVSFLPNWESTTWRTRGRYDHSINGCITSVKLPKPQPK